LVLSEKTCRSQPAFISESAIHPPAPTVNIHPFDPAPLRKTGLASSNANTTNNKHRSSSKSHCVTRGRQAVRSAPPVSNATLPIRNSFPRRSFHMCRITGTTIVAAAASQMGFSNWITP
jgi:hypothetical protein